MSFVPTFLRAVADGWDAAVGRNPVDRHADEARELLFYTPPEPGQAAVVTGVVKKVSLLGGPSGDLDPGDVLYDDDPDEVVVPTADLGPGIDVAVDLAEARREIARVQASYEDEQRVSAKARADLDMLTANVHALAKFLDGQAKAHTENMVEAKSDTFEKYSEGLAEAYRDSAAELRRFVERTTEWTGRPLDAKLAEKNSDPADTAKDGDQLGMDWVDAQSTPCMQSGPGGWVCVRSRGHDGQHVATSGGKVLEVWPNEPALPADVQAVVDAARAYHARFYGWASRGSLLDPVSNGVVDAVNALDGHPAEQAEVPS